MFWLYFVVLSDHFCGVSYQKGNLFPPSLERTNKPIFPACHLWSCDDTIFLLIVGKQQLIIPCVVLLVTRRWFLYLVFVFLLGAICTREALRYDFLIAEKVNSPLCFHPALLERGFLNRMAGARGFPMMPHFVDVVWLVQVLTVWTFHSNITYKL